MKAIQQCPTATLGKPVWARATVLVAGSAMNILLAWFIFSALASLPVDRLVDSEIVIENVVPGSPADEAGLRVGDVIRGVDGQDILTLGQLSDRIGRADGDEVVLRVLRGTVPLAVYLCSSRESPARRGPDGRVDTCY